MVGHNIGLDILDWLYAGVYAVHPVRAYEPRESSVLRKERVCPGAYFLQSARQPVSGGAVVKS
jgi:hypothetical protein